MKKLFTGELRAIFRDEGAVLLLIGALVIYSALYGLIYEPEVVSKIPVAVVDLDQTPASRDLQRMLSATRAAEVRFNAESLDDAKALFMERKVDGVMLIAKGFEQNTTSGKQAHVSLYADGSYFLMYSGFLNAVADVVLAKGASLQQINLTQAGLEEQQVEAISKPISYKIEMLYNPYSGYATALLPAVFIVILQQVLLLGIGMIMGTRYEFGGWRELSEYSTLKIVTVKTLAYVVVYIPLMIYLFGAVYKYFGYPMHGAWWELSLFLTPYLLSVVFLGFTLGGLVKRRESTVLYYAVFSLFLIMISGISWSEQGMPKWLYGLGQVIPSSAAVNGFIRMRSCGATLVEVSHEWITLWVLTVVYFATALISVARARR